MSEFFLRIKNILFNEDYYKLSDEDKKFRERIKSHKLGDVIWATRYDFDWEKRIYEEGHDMGPYVVVKAFEDKLLCIFCTGSSSKKGTIKLGRYPFFYKDTFLHKGKIKVVDRLSYADANYENTHHLDNEDIDKILKIYKYNPSVKRYYDDFGIEKEFELPSDVELAIGDVVKYDNCFRVIINKTGEGLEAIKMDFFDSKNGLFNYQTSNIRYNDKCIIDPNKANYLNTLPKSQLLSLLRHYREYLNKNNDLINGILSRGSVVEIDDKYYFVYNIVSDRAYLHRLFKNDFGAITINNDAYKESFIDEINLDISNKYNVVYHLSESELEILRDIRKKYNKSNTKKNIKKSLKKSNKPRFDTCSIIEDKKMLGIRYLVLGYDDNKIITIMFDAFLGGNIIYKEFDICDEDIKECEKVDIIDIKMIRDNMANFDRLYKERTLTLDK